jgi:hypothetical protein
MRGVGGGGGHGEGRGQEQAGQSCRRDAAGSIVHGYLV